MPKYEKNIVPGFDIVGIQFKDVSFSTNDKFKSAPGPIEINPHFHVSSNLVEENLAVVLTVLMDADNVPFRFSVSCVGIFKMLSKPDENTKDRLTKVNCPTIIFPFIRQLISDMTVRMGFQPLLLPPMNFMELFGKDKNE